MNTTITPGTRVRVWNAVVDREYGVVVDVVELGSTLCFDVRLDSGKVVGAQYADVRTTASLY